MKFLKSLPAVFQSKINWLWGHSSNGRAGVLQALGCGFESHWLHGVQPPTPTEIIRWHELKFDFYKNFCYNN